MSRGRYYHTPLGETQVLTVLTHLWFAAKIAPVEEQKCFYEETDRAHVRERANEGIKFLFSRLRERMDDYSRWEAFGVAHFVATARVIQSPPSKGPA